MKAVSYARVSTDEQAREGFSLEAQNEKNHNHIKIMDWTFAGFYVDPGKSGKDLNRPEMKRLLEDLNEGKFNVLVVTKLDRLTRNIGDLYDLVGLFDKKQIKLVSITENIDTSSAMGRMFVFMLGIFAQWYRENLSEDVIRGMSKRAEKGLRNSMVRIMGYDYDEHGILQINEEKAQWVRWVFDKYNNGWAVSRITKELNMLNVPTMRGGTWHYDTVQKMLKNYTYIGMNHWKPKDLPEELRIIEKGKHQPIIGQELFDEVQKRMQRISNKTMNRSSFNYIFSTILKCGHCGKTFFARGAKVKGKTYRNYRCSGKDRLGNCTTSDIVEWKVEELFLKELNVRIDGIANNQKVEISKEQTDIEKERKTIQKQLDKSELMRDNWAYAFGEGKMPLEQYSRLMDAELKKVESLEDRLRSLPITRETSLTQKDIVDFYKRITEIWPKLSYEEKKEFVQMSFERIIIEYKNDKWFIKQIVMQN